MRKPLTKITLATAIGLALTLTLSCSEKCGDKKYDPETQFCFNNTDVANKCNGKDYDLAAQFCYNNSDVVNKCNGKEYTPETQFCGGNEVLDKCGGNEYSPETQFCDSRDNRTYKYVAIGTQTWMAENLNYAAKGSKCGGTEQKVHYESTDEFCEMDCKQEKYTDYTIEDENTVNCDKYGRLYDWATAKSNNVCPKGWHLPSGAEWKKLIATAGGKNVAGKNLKAKSGWSYNGKSGNGEDKFGFSALPGGNGSENSPNGFYLNAGSKGFWLSFANGGKDCVVMGDCEYIYMSYDGKNVGSEFIYINSSLYSVRCLKD